MSMGVVNSNEFELELERLTNPVKIVRAEIIKLDSPGRNKHDKNVPDALRKVIGENALTEGNKATALLDAFGISKSSQSAYKHGATSTDSYHQPDPELNSHITRVKTDIVDNARSTLLSAIKHITEEKLAATKPRDLAGIAKDMSTVVNNVEPDKNTNPNQVVQFNIYAPEVRKEESYDVIVLKDEFK